MFQYRATFVPSTFIIVGCGGTGSRLAPLLIQLVRSLCSKYNPHGWLVNPRVVFIDGDIVEEKNLLRQNFIAKDINQNKAMVLAQRYGRAYGIETHVIPQFLTPEGLIRYYVDGTGVTHDYCQGESQISKGVPISSVLHTINGSSDYCVISCVDNMDARRLIVSQLITWSKTIGSNVLFLDAGNEDTFGQARISTNTVLSTGNRFLNKASRDYSLVEDISSKLPENLLATFDIPFIPMKVQDYLTNASSAKTGSCADMDQTLQINSMMANMLLGFLQNFMFGNPINFVEMRYDAETGPSATPFSFHELASRDLHSQGKLLSDEEKVLFQNVEWPTINHTFQDIAKQYLAAQNAAWEEERNRLGDIPKLLRGDEIPSPTPVAAAPAVVPELQRSTAAAHSTGPIPELVREATPTRVDGASDVAQNRGSAPAEDGGDADGGADPDSEGERRLIGPEQFNVEGIETSNNEGGAQALSSEGLRDLLQSAATRDGYLVQEIMNAPVTLNTEIAPAATPLTYTGTTGGDALLNPDTVARFMRGIRSIRGDRFRVTPDQIAASVVNTRAMGDVIFNQNGIGFVTPADQVTNRYLRSGFLPSRDRISFGNPVTADQVQLTLGTIRIHLRDCLRILRSYEPQITAYSTRTMLTSDQANTLQRRFRSFFAEIDEPLRSILPLYRNSEISDDFTVSEAFTKLLVDTLNAVRDQDLSLLSRRAFSQAIHLIGSWFNSALYDLERIDQQDTPIRTNLLSAESPLVWAMRHVAILVESVEQDRAAARVESVETAQEPTVVRALTYPEMDLDLVPYLSENLPESLWRQFSSQMDPSISVQFMSTRIHSSMAMGWRNVAQFVNGVRVFMRRLSSLTLEQVEGVNEVRFLYTELSQLLRSTSPQTYPLTRFPERVGVEEDPPRLPFFERLDCPEIRLVNAIRQITRDFSINPDSEELCFNLVNSIGNAFNLFYRCVVEQMDIEEAYSSNLVAENQARRAAINHLVEAQLRAEETEFVQLQGFDAVDPNDFQEVEVDPDPIEPVSNIPELEVIQAPQELVQQQEWVVQDVFRETPVAEVAAPTQPLRHTRPRDHLGRFVSFET